VLYRFRLAPDREQEFIDGWSHVTRELRDHRGGLGSRLHRGPDGIWYAYAQWPSAEVRRIAFEVPIAPDSRATMTAAIIERLPEIVLEPVADYLILPPG
jgi:Antibiotic biosynthesis monooxygenase